MPVQVGGATQPTLVVPRKLKWYHYCMATALAGFIHTLNATLRYRYTDQSGILKPESSPHRAVIFCLWHNRLGVAPKLRSGYFRSIQRYNPTAGLVSASKDGGILARMFQSFGLTAVRGSSSRRGHHALRELTTLARRGYDIAITPDGPRGPRYHLQEGVVSLARLTGLPIIPTMFNFSKKIQLNSWDRFQVPLPFARCEVTFGEPILVPRTADEATREKLRQQVENTLRSLTRD